MQDRELNLQRYLPLHPNARIYQHSLRIRLIRFGNFLSGGALQKVGADVNKCDLIINIIVGSAILSTGRGTDLCRSRIIPSVLFRSLDLYVLFFISDWYSRRVYSLRLFLRDDEYFS